MSQNNRTKIIEKNNRECSQLQSKLIMRRNHNQKRNDSNYNLLSLQKGMIRDLIPVKNERNRNEIERKMIRGDENGK